MRLIVPPLLFILFSPLLGFCGSNKQDDGHKSSNNIYKISSTTEENNTFVNQS